MSRWHYDNDGTGVIDESNPDLIRYRSGFIENHNIRCDYCSVVCYSRHQRMQYTLMKCRKCGRIFCSGCESKHDAECNKDKRREKELEERRRREELQRQRKEEERRRRAEEERKKREAKEKREKRWQKMQQYAKIAASVPPSRPTVKSSISKAQSLDDDVIRKREQIRRNMALKQQVKIILSKIGPSEYLTQEKVREILGKEPEIAKKVEKTLREKHPAEYLKARLEYVLHVCEIAHMCQVKSLMGPGWTEIDRASLIQDLMYLPDNPAEWTAHHGFQSTIRDWTITFTGPDENSAIEYSDPQHPAHQASEAAERAHKAYHETHAEFG